MTLDDIARMATGNPYSSFSREEDEREYIAKSLNEIQQTPFERDKQNRLNNLALDMMPATEIIDYLKHQQKYNRNKAYEDYFNIRMSDKGFGITERSPYSAEAKDAQINMELKYNRALQETILEHEGIMNTEPVKKGLSTEVLDDTIKRRTMSNDDYINAKYGKGGV